MACRGLSATLDRVRNILIVQGKNLALDSGTHDWQECGLGLRYTYFITKPFKVFPSRSREGGRATSEGGRARVIQLLGEGVVRALSIKRKRMSRGGAETTWILYQST